MKSARGPVLSDGERSRTRVEGFTLVELLVVISIIAILSVIGITVFTGVQKGARDAQRRGDIDAISKALEVNYGTCPGTTNPYCAFYGDYFSGGVIPVDPNVDKSKLGTFGTDRDDSSNFGYMYFVLQPQGHRSATTYKVCADLESQNGWTGAQQDYCRSNQQ